MEKENKKILIAMILALIACVIWSGNFVVARGVIQWMNPVGFAFWRWVTAFICILPFAIPHYKNNIKFVRENPRFFIFLGIAGIGLFNTLIYIAAHHTSANNIALIATTSPIWTLFLSGVLKLEKLNRNKTAGIFIAFLGAATVILRGDISNIQNMNFNKGDVIVLVAALSWAIYSIMVKKKPHDMNPTFFLATAFFFGILFLIPLYGLEIYFSGVTPFTMKAFYAYIYVGLGASVIAGSLFNQSVFIIGPIRTSLIYYTMPIFSGILSIIYLGEHFYRYHIAGFALVLSGIIVSNLKAKL